jgi:transcriptional regulator with XRE-family HTH domain
MVSKRTNVAEFRPYPFEDMVGRPTTKEAPPFGKRMAALRKERGLTQVQLADKLGITVKAVDYYERRARNPSIEFVKRAAAALGVRAVDLVDDGAPRKSSRSKPGPVSQLEERLEKLRRLPKKQQEVVLKMLDGLLETR